MGRAIVTLIDRELISVCDYSSGVEAPVFVQRAERELAVRGEKIASREREVESTKQRLSRWTERLRVWESELEALEQRAELATKLASQPSEARTKVGRNERCPCGSGLKYKHCHGLAGRRPGSA